MKPKLNLDKKKLLENVFSRSLHGYSPDEVDKFLDKVIEDYGQYDLALSQLNAAVFDLKAELESKKSELASMSAMYNELKERVPSESQLSLLQKSGEINKLTSEVQKLVEQLKEVKARKD